MLSPLFISNVSSIFGYRCDLAAFKKQSAAKVVTVDMPLPPKTLESQNSTTVVVNNGSSDGVNRKVMLTAIDS